MFYDRLTDECKKANQKPTPLLISLGLSQGNLARWREGSSPTGEVLLKLADYFNVSVDYLLGKTDIRENNSTKVIPELASDQQELLTMWDKLDDAGRTILKAKAIEELRRLGG